MLINWHNLNFVSYFLNSMYWWLSNVKCILMLPLLLLRTTIGTFFLRIAWSTHQLLITSYDHLPDEDSVCALGSVQSLPPISRTTTHFEALVALDHTWTHLIDLISILNFFILRKWKIEPVFCSQSTTTHKVLRHYYLMQVPYWLHSTNILLSKNIITSFFF